MARTYGDAVAALNTLQSNFAVVDAIRKSERKMNEQAIPEMIEWLSKIGYQPSDLNNLNAIHIAGTKGKGSTAAFISSILNEVRQSHIPNAPKRIGLYTSPHLRFVRERIQINGQPLTEAEFTRYFFDTWDRLESSAAAAGEDAKATSAKPVYFRFLTLMAFHTYISESVDCAVIECGIGGAYDSTNIIPSPAITAITSLGIDHVGVLGSTIEEIAWHKAGIMKARPSSSADRLKCFTPLSQPAAARGVLSRVASEQATDLIFTDVHPDIASGSLPLGLSASFQQTNASLALAITTSFLSSRGLDTTAERPQSCIQRGLASVTWPGRCDTRVDTTDNSITWHIDGGHTLESMELAGRWFGEQLQVQRHPSRFSAMAKTETNIPSPKRRKTKTYLIFNQQTRDAPSLATALYNTLASTVPNDNSTSPSSTTSSTSSNPTPSSSPFNTVIFTTNQTTTTSGFKPDLLATNTDAAAVASLTVQKQLAEVWRKLDGKADVFVVRSVEEAVGIVRGEGAGEAEGVEARKEGGKDGAVEVDDAGEVGEQDVAVEKVVLVTGSLHLVGGVLEVLEGGSSSSAKTYPNSEQT